LKTAESLPEVQLERRDEPACRLEQAYSAPTVSLVREEATNLPEGLRDAPAAKDLQGRPAVLSR
jgi:hypothetical protein